MHDGILSEKSLDACAGVLADIVRATPGLTVDSIEDVSLWRLRIPDGLTFWDVLDHACARGLVTAVIGLRAVFLHPL